MTQIRTIQPQDDSGGFDPVGGQEAPESPHFGPALKSAVLFNPKPVQWLWEKNIALGKLTVIGGNPGTAKSLLGGFLTTVTTTGRRWPDGSPGPEPGGVLFVSAEDDTEDTTVPRLMAAGADLNRVFILQGIQDLDSNGRIYHRQPSLEDDVRHLESAMEQVSNCKLLVLDPVSAFVGGTDSHNNAEVRGILAPLAELAQRKGVAVVMVTHLNKGAGDAIYRMMGSVAFTAAARAAWAVAVDKEDPDRRLFVPVKNNLGNDRQGYAYRVESVPPFQAGDLTLYDQPVLRWEEEPLSVTANEALAPAEERSERDEAAEWVREQLASGPRPVKELQQEANASGMGWETVKKAKAKAGVKSHKRGFSQGWVWALPGQIDEEEGQPSGEGAAPSERTPSGDRTSSPENNDLHDPDSAQEREGGQAEGAAPLDGQEWEADV